MPAQYKYSKGQNKRRMDHSSSSQSYHNHRDKDNKPYRQEKWNKRQRSRSRSNPKQESKYKFTYYPKEKEEHRYNERHFEFKRNNENRKRDPSDQRRDRNDDKNRESRYVYNRNDNRSRERERNDRQYRKEDKRQKSIQNKRWRSPESRSSSSPRNYRQDKKRIQIKYNFNKKSQNQKYDRKENQQNKFKYFNITQQEVRKDKYTFSIKDQQLQQKSDVYQKNQHYGHNTDQKTKFMMKMPPPPPIRNSYDNIKPKYERQFKKDQQKKEMIQLKEDRNPRREQNQLKKDVPKFQSYTKNSVIEQNKKDKQQHGISPLKRFYEIRHNHQPISVLEQIPKVKFSKVQLVLNQAKINIQIQPPPVNFMTLDTFRNMNKFQVETMDQKWVHKIRHQMDKTPDIKQLLSGVTMPVSEQSSPHLWTYLKEERDEQEHDIRFRLEELRMHNTNLNELVRKLKFID